MEDYAAEPRIASGTIAAFIEGNSSVTLRTVGGLQHDRFRYGSAVRVEAHKKQCNFSARLRSLLTALKAKRHRTSQHQPIATYRNFAQKDLLT